VTELPGSSLLQNTRRYGNAACGSIAGARDLALLEVGERMCRTKRPNHLELWQVIAVKVSPPWQVQAERGGCSTTCRADHLSLVSPAPILGYLETSRRIGVWPDSVQVSGGTLSFGLPTRMRVWLTFGLMPDGHRDEAWLKKGLPCS